MVKVDTHIGDMFAIIDLTSPCCCIIKYVIIFYCLHFKFSDILVTFMQIYLILGSYIDGFPKLLWSL